MQEDRNAILETG